MSIEEIRNRVGGRAIDMRRNKDLREEAVGQFNDVLAGLRKRRGASDRRAGLSARDLFGESIDRSTDVIRSGANERKRSLAGANALSGGDVSGRFSTELARTDQDTNEALRKLMLGFENQATGVRENALGRGDQLMRLLLGGQGSMLNFRDAQVERAQRREDQRKQARRQLFADILGLGGNVLGEVFDGGGGAQNPQTDPGVRFNA